MDVSVVSVGPYCTLDGDVHSPSGARGNRQNTECPTVNTSMGSDPRR